MQLSANLYIILNCNFASRNSCSHAFCDKRNNHTGGVIKPDSNFSRTIPFFALFQFPARACSSVIMPLILSYKQTHGTAFPTGIQRHPATPQRQRINNESVTKGFRLQYEHPTSESLFFAIPEMSPPISGAKN